MCQSLCNRSAEPLCWSASALPARLSVHSLQNERRNNYVFQPNKPDSGQNLISKYFSLEFHESPFVIEQVKSAHSNRKNSYFRDYVEYKFNVGITKKANKTCTLRWMTAWMLLWCLMVELKQDVRLTLNSWTCTSTSADVNRSVCEAFSPSSGRAGMDGMSLAYTHKPIGPSLWVLFTVLLYSVAFYLTYNN